MMTTSSADRAIRRRSEDLGPTIRQEDRSMKRICVFVVLVVSAGPTLGQEKYDFKPRVKADDVFTSNFQVSEKVEFQPEGLLSGTMTRTIEYERRVLEVKDGRPVRLDERILKHEDKINARAAGIPLDKTEETLKGVSIRYELVGEDYQSMLLDGTLNSDVAERLKVSPVYPLDENFLPTKDLAVGESEDWPDGKRLGWMVKDAGKLVKFEEGPKITLEKVATVDGVKTAFLKLEFRGKSLSDEPTAREPETCQSKATILFDLDRGYVMRVETRSTARAPGEINGKKGIATVESVTVSRTRKK
jgi:hypothetical protein